VGETEVIIYGDQDYKTIIKSLMKLEHNMTNKELAGRIPIQSTYLSKFFNNPNSHLKDETLFRIGRVIGISDEQAEHLIVLKNFESCETPERKEYLLKKINSERKRKLEIKRVQKSDNIVLSSKYLLDPKCMLVQLALRVTKYRSNPRLLCSELNLNLNKLLEILDLIENLGFIQRNDDPFEILSISDATFHIDDELMRIHQNLFKTIAISRLNDTNEESKKSFNAVFNMDEKGFKEVQELFDKFINNVKNVAQKSSVDGVYQLTFDHFKWT